MKVGDLVVHAKGTVFPHKYLLGVIVEKNFLFEAEYDVVWFHSGFRQVCRDGTLIKLEDYASR